MELDLAHLERGRVAVPHQIGDQGLVLGDLLGAAPVGDTSGLHHGTIVAHIIDHTHKTVIEQRSRLIENILKLLDGGAPGLGVLRPGLIDLGLLFRRHWHCAFHPPDPVTIGCTECSRR